MLSLHQLIQPISDAVPCGTDISFSPQVDAIEQARRSDDPTLDQGEWVTSLKEADWESVYAQCMALLSTQTKDLRLLGWLVEAAAKTRQLGGMAASLAVMAQLCETYWDQLHPQLDAGDAERRIGNLAWLATRAVQLIKDIPLTQGRTTAYSWTDFEAARARANHGARTGDASPRALDGQPGMPMLEAARLSSSAAFYAQLIGDAEQCRLALAQLEQALDARLGTDGPSFTPPKEMLETVLTTLERFGRDVGLRAPTFPSSNPTGDGEASAGDALAAEDHASGPLQTRAQALEQLRAVAEYFRRTEPHSPVAYLADKAASWGNLSLHTWLKSVVKDPASLASIEEMLGVHVDQLPAATD